MAEQATFNLNLGGDMAAAAAANAAEMERLRSQLTGASEAVKALQADQRRLVGSSEEIKKARGELKVKIEAERETMGRAQLGLQKMGVSYDLLTSRLKKTAAEQEKLKASEAAKSLERTKEKVQALSSLVDRAGGPLSVLQARLGSIGAIGGTAAGGLGVVAFAAGALIGVVALLTSKVIESAVSLAQWVLATANAYRTLGLVREALTGSTTQAAAFGSQVDALAGKIHTPKEEIEGLAKSLYKAQLRGQTFVDALNAVGQAGAAAGEDVGAKLKAKIEQGILANGAEGRFQLGRFELQGTGLEFQDVAKSLAKQTKIGVEQAKQALQAGTVRLGAGAAALRDAVEKKFGNINLRRMLDINVIAKKFKETLASLVRDVKLDALLEGVSKLAGLFDTSAVTGASLKGIIARISNAIIDGFSGTGAKAAQYFFYGLVIGALRLELTFYKVRNALNATFGGSTIGRIDTFGTALKAGEYALYAVAAAVILTGVAIASGVAIVAIWTDSLIKGVGIATGAWSTIYEGAKGAWAKLTTIDWNSIGTKMIDGLVQGIKSGVDRVEQAVKDLGEAAKKSFTKVIDSHSPSRVFEAYGETIPEGAALGVRNRSSDVDQAIARMVDVPGARPAGSGRGATPIQLEIHIHVDSEATARAFPLDAVRAEIVKVLEETLLGAGLPVMQ